MKTVVLKFGGTSVGSITRIKKICKIILKHKKRNNRLIVISSAMSGTTNKLVNMSKNISLNFIKSEYDALVSAGEQISCALIAGYLNELGIKARSFMSWQIPILTDAQYSNARILKILKKNLQTYCNKGGIPIIAGFQGVNLDNRLTTLGRGASDYTAIMFAKFFNASKCIIYTDVDGVMTTDPKIYKNANKIKKISYEEMLEMSSMGSKVMQSNSIQDARLNRITIDVRSSFNSKNGTIITKRENILDNKVIRGISFTTNDAKITLVGVKDKPGVAASIFKPLNENRINVDMVVQNISANGIETDVTFTIKIDDLPKTIVLIKQNKKIKIKKLIIDKKVSKVSIIGVGMITTPGVTFRMFNTLSKNNINIMVISTSEIKISVLIKKINTKKAVSSLHKEFKLDK